MEKYFGLILALCAIGGFLSIIALAIGIVYDTAKLEREFKEECERIEAKWEKVKQDRIEEERLKEARRSELCNHQPSHYDSMWFQYINKYDKPQNKQPRNQALIAKNSRPCLRAFLCLH